MRISYLKRKSEEPKDAGAVTAEFAVVLPAVIFILALVLGACATGVAQIKLEESARVAARAAARGESAEDVQRIARDIEPKAQVNFTHEWNRVQVVTSQPAPGLIGNLTGWELTAEAITPAESREQP